VLSERHLRRVLIGYFAGYHMARPHLSLDKDSSWPVGGTQILTNQFGYRIGEGQASPWLRGALAST
jgi:hypothetical protein